MINKIRLLIGQTDKKLVVFVDTCFIEGTILKDIENDNWNKVIKPDKRLQELKDSNCLLLINDINIYEIKKKLLKDYNIPQHKINRIYQEAIDKIPNLKPITIEEIKINPALINWMLRHQLDLRDGLLINIAQGLEIPFVTSERKAEQWKDAYKGVMSQKDFWKKIGESKQNSF